MTEQSTLSESVERKSDELEKWEEVPFSSLVSEMRNGMYKKKDFYGEGCQIVKMGELFEEDFITNDSSMDRLELTDNELEKHGLQPGDLLFARRSYVREGAGKCSIVADLNEPLVPESSIIKAQLNEDVVDPRFYAYYFQSPQGEAKMAQIVRQTAVSGIAQSDLKEIQVANPPKEVQERIADNIELFDEKIRINWELNKTLEGIVRTAFRSWFVDFDRHSEHKESEIGKIPDGWRVGTLGELMEKVTDSVDADEVPDSEPYIGLKHMPEGSISLDTWGEAEEVSSRKYRFRRGQILFGRLRPYFCKVGVAPLEGISSTDIQIIVPKQGDVWEEFLVCYLSNQEFINYCEKVSTGTRMPRVGWDDMCDYSITIPPEDRLQEFHKFASPIIEEMTRNIHESRKLQSVRNSLLPKLISGDIKARDITLGGKRGSSEG